MRRAGILAAVAAIAVLATHAGTMPVKWNAVAGSDIAGYRVYIGAAPGNYTRFVDVGNITSVPVTGLTDCATNYIAVKAIDTAGQLSQTFSNEVAGYPSVSIDPAGPRTFEAGGTYSVSVAGANFKPGATVAFESGATTINGTAVSITSCNALTFTVAIPATAPTGSYSLVITNADRTWRSLPAAAAVGTNPPPPDVTGVSRTDQKAP